MAKIVWDQTGEHIYETGVDHGVLYVMNAQGAYPDGVAWNGLTGVTESPSGAEANAIYADNIKYLNLYSAEEFGATVEAYTYPDEFALCDGSAALGTGLMIGQQPRKTFGLCYRTVVGNDVAGESFGYKLHIIYGAMASPSEKAYQTINDSPEAITFSWELNTTPVNVAGHKPTATLTIDSTKASKAAMDAIEAVLYGDNTDVYFKTADAAMATGKTYYTRSGAGTTESPYTYSAFSGESFASNTDYYEKAVAGPRLPLPDEVASIMSAA